MLTAVILISGAGTNMLALADNLPDGVRIAAVGADRDAPGLAGAQQRGIPVFVHERRDGQSRQAWAAGLQDRIDQFEPDIVVLSGFMCILPEEFVAHYAPHLINTHPAMLPEFPGAHAVRDALAAGAQRTGATVHIVDAGVDSGPILVQEPVEILPGDDEGALHARIKQVERRLLRSTLAQVAAGTLNLDALGGRSE
ncbi:MAG TPA: phosphoribosylglycinamide formyltransferase [Pseudoclavibacter sp.]|nr:phosphoribosylglycinamide formyltransferase [Pseudoclavibacter sp.]